MQEPQEGTAEAGTWRGAVDVADLAATPELVSTLAGLRETRESIERLSAVLADRLGPVLRDPGPDRPSEPPALARATSYARALQDETDALDGAARTLSSILDRLEV